MTLWILAGALVLFDGACVAVITVFVKRARPATEDDEQFVLGDW